MADWFRCVGWVSLAVLDMMGHVAEGFGHMGGLLMMIFLGSE